MEPRAWIVAILFGLAGGLVAGRQRQERRQLLAAILLTTAIGVVVWLINPAHIAGPSLTVGGATALAGALAVGWRPRASS